MYKFRIIGALLILGASGCFPEKSYSPHKEKKAFVYPVRQDAPEPVYNRLTYVLPPSPLPSYEGPGRVGEPMVPVVHLEFKNAKLEEIASALAMSARYRAYTSGLIANRRVSFNALGTIDELAHEISNKVGINVMVDHVNKEVRFLAKRGAVTPSFPKEVLKEQSDEHKSNN